MLSEVTKIVQTPGLTLIMHELDNATRQIYTDGRPHPVDPNPSWLGYSTGRWDNDTLVVETIGFNGKAPLDISGHPEASPCGSRNDTGGATSGTSTSRSRSTIR